MGGGHLYARNGTDGLVLVGADTAADTRQVVSFDQSLFLLDRSTGVGWTSSDVLGIPPTLAQLAVGAQKRRLRCSGNQKHSRGDGQKSKG